MRATGLAIVLMARVGFSSKETSTWEPLEIMIWSMPSMLQLTNYRFTKESTFIKDHSAMASKMV